MPGTSLALAPVGGGLQVPGSPGLPQPVFSYLSSCAALADLGSFWAQSSVRLASSCFN